MAAAVPQKSGINGMLSTTNAAAVPENAALVVQLYTTNVTVPICHCRQMTTNKASKQCNATQ
jgi:hypothetical protein